MMCVGNPGYNSSATQAQINAEKLGTGNLSASERERIMREFETMSALAGIWATQHIMISELAGPFVTSTVRDVAAINRINFVAAMDEDTARIFRNYFYTGIRISFTENAERSAQAATAGTYSPHAFTLMHALEPRGGGLLGIPSQGDSEKSARLATIMGGVEVDPYNPSTVAQLIHGNFPLMVEDRRGNPVFNAEVFEDAMQDLDAYLGDDDAFALWDAILRQGYVR